MRTDVRPATFLDRDGVLNRAELREGKPHAPRRLEVRALREAGFLIVVVTNQPDIGNGHVDRQVVDAMHARLRRRLPVDAIEVCPHRQTDGCPCRKPQPGMLLAAAERLGIDLRRSFMVGDDPRDIQAGRSAGCYTVLVDRGYPEAKPVEADAVARSFPAAVRRILAVATKAGSEEGRR